MEKQIEKFLQFNEKEILCRKIDGKWWVAIKPICDALNIDYIRQFKNITKEDHFLRDVLSNQTMHDTIGREQEMISLPEFYIYGWLFEANGKSEEYKLYKWKCYEVLHDHFHGTITKRTRILEEKAADLAERIILVNSLSSTTEFSRIKLLDKRIKAYPKALKALDEELSTGQTSMDINN